MKIFISLLKKQIKKLYDLDIRSEDIILETPPKKNLGQVAVSTFFLSKELKKNPALIAGEITKELENEKIISSVKAAGPYINIFFTSEFFLELLENFSLPEQEKNNGKKILIDYFGVNIGKPLHVGHLCSPTYGQAFVNIFSYLGYDVIADIHQGDWGGIFGKLIAGWNRWGDEKKLEENAVEHLLELYIKITALTEKEPEVEQECRDIFGKLSAGDKVSVELWKKFTTLSLDNAKGLASRMYTRPSMTIGESFYEWLNLPKIGEYPDLKEEEKMGNVVKELIEKKVAEKNEDNSVGVQFPKETKMPSTILQKKDGTHGYFASDLAGIKYRCSNWSPEKILYFVDNRQELHFRQLFYTAKEAWNFPTEFHHAKNGFIKLKDGAMSTRKGRIIRLEEVFDEGIKRVEKLITEKNTDISADDIEKISISSVKYSLLSQDREKDVIFDWDKALSFEGNSAPYIQYAYVRAKKILEDLGYDEKKSSLPKTGELNSYEMDFIRALYDFEEVLEKSLSTLKTHHLTLYSYKLAVLFNSFYVHGGNIVQEKNTDVLQIKTHLLSSFLKTTELSFQLLGLSLPNKM